MVSQGVSRPHGINASTAEYAQPRISEPPIDEVALEREQPHGEGVGDAIVAVQGHRSEIDDRDYVQEHGAPGPRQAASRMSGLI